MVDRIILATKVKCSNNISGCYWIGDLGDLWVCSVLRFKTVTCRFRRTMEEVITYRSFVLLLLISKMFLKLLFNSF